MDATRYLSFIFNSVLHSLLWRQKPPPSAATCHGWSSKYVESCVESPSTAFSCLLFFFLLKTLSFCYPRFKRGHENFLPFFAQTEHSETTCLPFTSSHQSCCSPIRSAPPFNLFRALTQCNEICVVCVCDNSVFNKIYRAGADTYSVIHLTLQTHRRTWRRFRCTENKFNII